MRTQQKAVLAVLAGLVLPACRSCEPAPAPRLRAPALQVLDRTTVLAELPDEAPAAESHGHPTEYTFAPGGRAVVWFEQGKDGRARVFHNGRAGPAYDEVGDPALSPDGRHHAYGGRIGEEWRLVVDGAEAPGRYRDLGSLQYSPDGAHLVFQARYGDEARLLVDGEARRSAPEDFISYQFGADSASLVVEELAGPGRNRVVVGDPSLRSPTVVDSVPWGLKVSADGTRVAVVTPVEGGQRVLSFGPDRPQSARRGKRYDRVVGVDLGPQGEPLAYLARRGGETVLVVETDEVVLQQGEELVAGAAPRPGERGFGALVRSGGAVTFRQYLTEAAPPEPSYDEAFGLAYGGGGRLHAYAARRGDRWLVVVNGKEGPTFDAVRPPDFSPDGRLVVYRARRDGRRFVVVAGLDGKTLREHPAHDEVHEVRFTADGKAVAYGVRDGRRLVWQVEAL